MAGAHALSLTPLSRNWQRLMLLEQRKLQVPGAKLLWDDMTLAHTSPIRLLHMFSNATTLAQAATADATCSEARY